MFSVLRIIKRLCEKLKQIATIYLTSLFLSLSHPLSLSPSFSCSLVFSFSLHLSLSLSLTLSLSAKCHCGGGYVFECLTSPPHRASAPPQLMSDRFAVGPLGVRLFSEEEGK